MLSFFNIPKQCVLNLNIPLEKFFGEDPSIRKAVISVHWRASIKPMLTGTAAVNSGNIRYEEIQILSVELKDSDNLFAILHGIYKQIKYPCLVDVQYKDKFLISTCQFRAGKIDRDNNIIYCINCSHWIHPDLLSAGALQMIDEINKAFDLQGDLQSIYTVMIQAVQRFKLSCTTKSHINSLLFDMIGKTLPEKFDDIMKFCTPYKKYAPINKSRAAKFDKTKRVPLAVCLYDYEEIWYCFLKNEQTLKVVQGRRYRDIQDLIVHIDTKQYCYLKKRALKKRLRQKISRDQKSNCLIDTKWLESDEEW